MNVLGISAFYHDSAACLVQDGRVVAAAQEERFTRVKGDDGFPVHAVNACLQAGGLTPLDVEHVAFYEKPYARFERSLVQHVLAFPRSLPNFLDSLPRWLSQRLVLPMVIEQYLGCKPPVLYPSHHLAHAASAFLSSPFETAAILTVDGVGEWAAATWGEGRGSTVELREELHYPDSLGLVYSAVTDWLGFEVNRGEGKVMALADFGEPAYLDELKRIVRLGTDGSFRVDESFFGFNRGRHMYGRKFVKRFGAPRVPKSELTQRDRDMAASLQALLEEALLSMARHIHERTGERDLCMAGGVALNCSANSRLLRDGPFERIFVHPAAGDAGAALGAALLVATAVGGAERPTPLASAALGPSFSDRAIRAAIAAEGLTPRELEPAALYAQVAEWIDAGRVVGWYEGRLEWGPRALGQRSILADPRVPDMKDRLNQRVKHREWFRPYGVSVLHDRQAEWFSDGSASPYMLRVFHAHPGQRERIPGGVHVNGTSRIQSVTRAVNGPYYDVIAAFAERTGVPMVINTSFNDNNEPIVCTPQDAIRCYLRTEMDCLALPPFVLEKAAGQETAGGPPAG
jgi:carbamoyltransferase